jgi:hypothetical protein
MFQAPTSSVYIELKLFSFERKEIEIVEFDKG